MSELSKEFAALLKQRGMTEEQGRKALADETAAVAESLKGLPREVWEAQLAAAKAEEVRREEADNASFAKKINQKPDEVARECMENWGFRPSW
jgi:hypothetical protein